MLKNIVIGSINAVKGWTASSVYYPAHIRALTLADALWLGSSLDCRAPAPRLGSCVWKTDMRPPVGDSSLKPAWRAEPRADWVSIVFWNKVGKLFSRSCTSWKEIRGWVLYTFTCWNDWILLSCLLSLCSLCSMLTFHYSTNQMTNLEIKYLPLCIHSS